MELNKSVMLMLLMNLQSVCGSLSFLVAFN
jgi:hypothetical protein